jgi:DNA-binding NarL/FixJ family response regulator
VTRRGVRLLVVADQEPVRKDVETAIAASPDIVLAGVITDAGGATAAVHAIRPHVVLIDVGMAAPGGAALADAIAADPALSGTRIVMLAGTDQDWQLFRTLRSAAAGFVRRERIRAELGHVVRCVVQDSVLPMPSATRALVCAVLPDLVPAESSAFASLTDLECSVVCCVAAGLTNRHITMIFGFDAVAFCTFVRQLKVKLAARERMQVAIAGYASGLVRTTASDLSQVDLLSRTDPASASLSDPWSAYHYSWPSRDFDSSTWLR